MCINYALNFAILQAGLVPTAHDYFYFIWSLYIAGFDPR